MSPSLNRSTPLSDESDALKHLCNSARAADLAGVQHWLARCDPRPDSAWVLCAAIDGGSADILKLLLPLTDPGADNCLALEKACSNFKFDLAALLAPLSDCKHNPEPLYLAARMGKEELVRELLPRCDPRSLKVIHALATASNHQRRGVVAFLAETGDVPAAWQTLVRNQQWAGADNLTPFLPITFLQQKVAELALSGPQLTAYLPQSMARLQAEALASTLASDPPDPSLPTPGRARF